MTIDVRDVGDVAVALVGFAGGATWLGALPHHPGPPAVRLVRGGPVVSPPPRACDLELDELTVWWRSDGSVVVEGPDTRAHITDAVAAIAGGADTRSERRLVALALMHLLAPRGRFVLHAGAFAEAGRAWLVVGRSGSGKSTVAAAALARGWAVLGDDLVVVRSGPDGPEVRGIPVPMAVPAEVGLVGTPARGDPRGRVLVDVPGVSCWLPVRGVVAVTHGTGPGRLMACAGDRVLPTLLASSLVAGERRRLGAYFPCAAALARLPSFTVELAADPALRPGALGEALDSLAVAATGPAAARGQRSSMRAAPCSSATKARTSSASRP